jgi:hypothetical protein
MYYALCIRVRAPCWNAGGTDRGLDKKKSTKEEKRRHSYSPFTSPYVKRTRVVPRRRPLQWNLLGMLPNERKRGWPVGGVCFACLRLFVCACCLCDNFLSLVKFSFCFFHFCFACRLPSSSVLSCLVFSRFSRLVQFIFHFVVPLCLCWHLSLCLCLSLYSYLS